MAFDPLARWYQEWSLTPVDQLQAGAWPVHSVMTATGELAVLKSCPPGRSLARQAAALRAFDGRACARLIACAPNNRALLLEHISPGDTAAQFWPDDDHAAVEVFACVVAALHRPATTDQRGEQPSTAARLRPVLRRDRSARRLFVALRAAARDTPAVVLHGDLHHHNLLRTHRAPGWLAIDPHGEIGDPAREAGQFLGNPFGLLALPDAALVLRRRVGWVAEACGWDPWRVAGWASLQARLALAWFAEDNQRPPPGLDRVMDALEPLLRRGG